MKTCDEMVNSLFQRREEYLAQQKIKRRNAVISAALYSCAFAAAAGIGIWIKGEISQKPVTVDSSMANPASTPVTSDPAAELPIIWAEEGIEGELVVTDYYTDWNGKDIHSCLWDALEENKTDDSCIFAVDAFYFPLDDEFVYKGKTLAQYSEEQQGKRWELLNQLLKHGEALKYGEALYQSGAPDGEKWSKELYERTVSEIGEEMLSEYIVDGVFLRDKVLQDIPEAEKEWEAAQPAFMQACAAYQVHVYENTLEQLEAQGIKYELSKYDGRLILFVSREELDNLTLDNMSHWGFCLASKKNKLPIVWYEGFDYDDDIITVFGNKKVNSSLWGLSNEEQNDRLIAIEAEYTSIDKQFVYHGKTLAEYEAEKEAQTRKVDALNILLKDIEFLINNKDSYPSMSPEAKKYYDDTIAKIGEDHISEYIVNGVFQQEKASWDFACAAEDLRIARQSHDKACAAYRAKIYEETAKQLEAQGIKTAFSRDHDYLLLFISRDDFAKLELDNMSEWFFVHASKDIYWEEYVRLGGYTASDLPIEEND